MSKISVIIPVYNAGEDLSKCVSSVLGQTISDIEVICVDDCSTDGSPEVLEGFAKREPRLKVISFPENQGVSVARNAGLDAATGEWVYFLDSDDWLDDDYLEFMWRAASNSGRDIILNPDYIEEFPDSGKRARSSDFGFIEADGGVYDRVTVLNRFPPVVWARLFRREFLLREAIRFPKDILNGCEDIYFIGLATSLAADGQQLVVRGPWYHYIQRPSSLMKGSEIGWWSIVCFNLLYDELLTRELSTEGLRLFYAGPMVVDKLEKYLIIKEFFKRISDEVLRHKTLYAPIDLFLMDAILSSPDWDSFHRRYSQNISLSFLRSRMRGKC